MNNKIFICITAMFAMGSIFSAEVTITAEDIQPNIEGQGKKDENVNVTFSSTINGKDYTYVITPEFAQKMLQHARRDAYTITVIKAQNSDDLRYRAVIQFRLGDGENIIIAEDPIYVRDAVKLINTEYENTEAGALKLDYYHNSPAVRFLQTIRQTFGGAGTKTCEVEAPIDQVALLQIQHAIKDMELKISIVLDSAQHAIEIGSQQRLDVEPITFNILGEGVFDGNPRKFKVPITISAERRGNKYTLRMREGTPELIDQKDEAQAVSGFFITPDMVNIL